MKRWHTWRSAAPFTTSGSIRTTRTNSPGYSHASTATRWRSRRPKSGVTASSQSKCERTFRNKTPMPPAMQSLSEPSLDLILPFLEPIADVILDPGVSEIMVNGNGTMFAERGNRMESIEATIDRGMLEQAVKRIARPLGLDFGEHAPILHATLPDSSRVSAIWPGCSVGGITLTIRKFA